MVVVCLNFDVFVEAGAFSGGSCTELSRLRAAGGANLVALAGVDVGRTCPFLLAKALEQRQGTAVEPN